jgi:hypothetical protein
MAAHHSTYITREEIEEIDALKASGKIDIIWREPKKGFLYNMGHPTDLLKLTEKLKGRGLHPCIFVHVRGDFGNKDALNLYYTPIDPDWTDEILGVIFE